MGEKITGSIGSSGIKDTLGALLREELGLLNENIDATDELEASLRKLNKQGKAKYYMTENKYIAQINENLRKRNELLKDTPRSKLNEVQLKDLKKTENALRVTTSAYKDYLEVVYGGKKKLPEKVSELSKKLWANEKDYNGISQYHPDKGAFKELFKVIKKMQDEGRDLSKIIDGFEGSVGKIDWSKLIDVKEISKDIKAAEKEIDKLYLRIQDKKTKGKLPELTPKMQNDLVYHLNKLFTYYDKAGLEINKDLQNKIDELTPLVSKLDAEGNIRITRQHPAALAQIEEAQKKLPKIAVESAKQEEEATERVARATQETTEAIESETKAVSKFKEKVDELEGVISRSSSWIKDLDETGIFTKLLIGKDGSVKTIENIVDEVYDIWQKAYSKLRKDTKDVWSDEAFNRYKKSIEKIYPYIAVLRQSREGLKGLESLGQKNKEYLNFDHYSNSKVGNTTGYMLYREWADSFDLSRKSNANGWKIFNEFETNLDLVSAITSSFEMQNDLAELRKIGEEEYLQLLTRETALKEKLSGLDSKYPGYNVELLDKGIIAESDLTVEQAKHNSEALEQEANSLDHLISEVEYFIGINDKFENSQVDIFDKWLVKPDVLKELQGGLLYNAMQYKNIGEIRKINNGLKFDEATEQMIPRSTPREIEKLWSQISNACYNGEKQAADAIEEFKREAESLGYVFDEQSKKWQTLQTINPDVSASLAKLKKLRDAYEEYAFVEEEVRLAEEDSKAERSARRVIELLKLEEDQTEAIVEEENILVQLEDTLGRKLNENNSKLLQRSAMIDEQTGRLDVLYHGSPSSFSEFDKTKLKPGLFGTAAYFDLNKQQTENYAGNNGTISQWFTTATEIFRTDSELSRNQLEFIFNEYKEFLQEKYKDLDSFIADWSPNGVTNLNGIAAELNIDFQELLSKLGFSGSYDPATGIVAIGDLTKLIKAERSMFEEAAVDTQAAIEEFEQINKKSHNIKRGQKFNSYKFSEEGVSYAHWLYTNTLDFQELNTEDKARKIALAIDELEEVTGKTLAEIVNNWDNLDASIKKDATSILSKVGLVSESQELLFSLNKNGFNTRGGDGIAIITDELVILQKAANGASSDLVEFVENMQRLNNAGVGVPRLFGAWESEVGTQNFKRDIGKGGYSHYQIMEKVQGEELHKVGKGIATIESAIEENDKILQLTKEQLKKFILDYIAISKELTIDPKSNNFIMQNDGVIKFIDLAKKVRDEQNEYIVSNIISSLTNGDDLGNLTDWGRLKNQVSLTAQRIAQMTIDVLDELKIFTTEEIIAGVSHAFSPDDLRLPGQSPTPPPSEYKGQLEAEINARSKIKSSVENQLSSTRNLVEAEKELTASVVSEEKILTSAEKAAQRRREEYARLKEENASYSREAVKYAEELLRINGLLTQSPTTNLKNINTLASNYDNGDYNAMYSNMADIALNKRNLDYLKEEAPLTFEILSNLRNVSKIKYSESDVQAFGSAWEFVEKTVGKARLSLTEGIPLEKIISDEFGEGLRRAIYDRSNDAVSGLGSIISEELKDVRKNLISTFTESGNQISLSEQLDLPKTISSVEELEDALRKTGITMSTIPKIISGLTSGDISIPYQDVLNVIEKLQKSGTSVPDGFWDEIIIRLTEYEDKLKETAAVQEEIINPPRSNNAVAQDFKELQSVLASELINGKKIISQNWLGDIKLVYDEEGNAFLKGVYSYVEELRKGQRQVVKAVYEAAYDESTGMVDSMADHWTKTTVNLKTMFKSIEDQVLSSDAKISKMENNLSRGNSEYGSLPALERKIALEKEHRDELLRTLEYYDTATTYVKELDREEKLYEYDMSTFLDERIKKQNEVNAAIEAENELISKKQNKAQDTRDANRINAVNRQITTWENQLNKIINRYDSSVNPNADKVVPVGSNEYNQLLTTLGQIYQRLRQIKDTAADPSVIDSIQKDINAFDLMAKNAMDSFKVKTSNLTGSNLKIAVTNELNELDTFIANCKLAGSVADEVRKKAEETRKELELNQDASTYNKAKDALSNYRTELTKVIAEEKVNNRQNAGQKDAAKDAAKAQKDAATEEEKALNVVKQSIQSVYDAYYKLFNYLKTGKGNFNDLFANLLSKQTLSKATLSDAVMNPIISSDSLNRVANETQWDNQEKFANELNVAYDSILKSVDSYIEKMQKSSSATAEDITKIQGLRESLVKLKAGYDAGQPSIDAFVSSLNISGTDTDTLTRIFEQFESMVNSKNFKGMDSLNDYLKYLANSGVVAENAIEPLKNSLIQFFNASYQASSNGFISSLNDISTQFAETKKATDSRINDFKELDSIMKSMSKASFTSNKTSSFVSELESIKQEVLFLKNNWIGDEDQQKKLEELTNKAIKLKQTANGFKEVTSKGKLSTINLGKVKDTDALKRSLDEYVESVNGYNLKIKQVNDANKSVTFTYKDQSNNIVRAKASVDELSNSMRVLNTSTRKYMTIGEAFSSELKTIFSRLTYTFSTAGLIMKLTSAFREGVSSLKEYDSALTTISYTMDLTKSELNQLGESAMKMSEDLSMSLDNAMSIYQIYANMNTTAAEIAATGKSTAILSNLSGVDASTAADQVQGVIQQFSLLKDAETDVAETSMHVVDVLDKISSNVAIDYAKLKLAIILEII